MKTLNFTCRYCQNREKIVLNDVFLTEDNAEVEGICEVCFDDGEEGRKEKKAAEELVPCPPDVSRYLEDLFP